MNKSLRIDFWIILGIILVSIPIILQFQVRPLTSALFFFIIPSIYLILRKPKPLKRIIFGTLLIGVGFGFIFNIIASANKAWDELSHQLVFNYRLFGFWPVDEPIWFILWALFILVFYEHFYEREKTDYVSKRFKYIAIPLFLILIAVFATFALNQESFRLSYAYLFLALPSVVPITYVLKRWPHLFIKFFKTSIFFFMLHLIYEITALKLGQWYFPGEYVGFVELAGVRFPFEELFFWMMLSGFAVLSLYEGFVDDEK